MVSTYNILIVFTAALGSFTYGFDSAIIGSVFGLPSFFTYFNLTLNGAGSASIIGGTGLSCLLDIVDVLTLSLQRQMVCLLAVV